MQNWSGEENAAMRGYILYAAKVMNNRDGEQISEEQLETLLHCLYRATDDMTTQEAYNYFMNSKYN